MCLCLVGAALPACDPRPPRRDAGQDAADPARDRDADAILDLDEGPSGRDIDGDGIPDASDDDSDGDGLTDRDEAGDGDPETPPRDADGDGKPDAYDLDSDDNGIEDRDEPATDGDGDGVLSAHDLDDDGDSLLDAVELRGSPSAPPDSDGDGAPNHDDVDSDGDTITDTIERYGDTDHDEVPDALDLDADGDGLLDVEEAGDLDPLTPPPDSDGDGQQDFRDADSDGDGLTDRDEATLHGTSPTLADSDDDGVSDLIEVTAGTDARSPSDSPRTRGDFVFLVPYEADPMPQRDTLSFRTRIQLADLYFLFDRSGSMSGEIGALRGAVDAMLTDLTCASSGRACMRDTGCVAGEVCSIEGWCIEDPAIHGCIASPHSGAGHYLGELTNVLSIQADPARTASALSFSVTGSTEAMNRALWGLADPLMAPGAELGCTPTGIGCAGFRSDAVRIAVVFTDEDSDGLESGVDAASALSRAGVRVIGVWSGLPGGPDRSDLVEVATRSGSLDRTGAPMVFDGADAAVVPVVSRAITEIVEGVPLRVTIELEEVAGDDGDAAAFVSHLVARSDGCTTSTAIDTDADGVLDTFPAVTPGDAVCWDVVVRRNDRVPATARPQLFRARLTVRGDGSPLDGRNVFFLVPPRPPTIEVPE